VIDDEQYAHLLRSRKARNFFLPCTPDYTLLASLFFASQSSTTKNPAQEISSRVQGCFLAKVGEVS
jgi:hypothetical protein